MGAVDELEHLRDYFTTSKRAKKKLYKMIDRILDLSV